MPTNLYGEFDNFDFEKSHVMPALIRKTLLCKMLEESDFESIAGNLGIEFENEEQLLKILKQYGIEKNGTVVTLNAWGSGKPYREFMHVNDMAEACVFVMNSVNFKDLTVGMKEIKNTHINLGTGLDVTIKELLYKIKDIVGFRGDIKFDTTKPDGTPRKLLDVSKVNNLGWKSKIDLDSGLEQAVKWYKENS
jgi:GDP-L-fucose synthase